MNPDSYESTWAYQARLEHEIRAYLERSGRAIFDTLNGWGRMISLKRGSRR